MADKMSEKGRARLLPSTHPKPMASGKLKKKPLLDNLNVMMQK